MRRLLFLLTLLFTTTLLSTLSMRCGWIERVMAAPLATSEGKQEFPRPNWDLKYRSGSLQAKKDSWIKGAFLTGQVEEEKTKPMVAVPRDDVRAIYFNSTAQQQSDVAQRMPRSGCYQARFLMPRDESTPGPKVFAVWAASPGRLIRAAERLNERYPIRLVWEDNGAEKELVFTVSHCEYASLVANLRWFAGERWKDVSREFPR